MGESTPLGSPPAPPPVPLGCWGSARPWLSPDPVSPRPARCQARVSPWCPPPVGCGGGKGGNGSPEETLPWPCHGLSFLRTSDGVWGTRAGTSRCHPARGEGLSRSDALPGITKAALPLARAGKVLPVSWALAQPALAVYLASRSSQHTPTCSWEPRVLQRGCPGHRAGVPSAPRPCSLPCHLGRNYSLSFRSGWRGCSGCSWHRLLKASHPSGASREAGSILSTLIRPLRSGPGTVYWTGSEGFGFAAVSSAVDGCCF